ncbi:MAG: alcohol dehydrogenase catalytic domain-containing protein [Chloroflexi bacterium]|nr:alcohol dehydrogenase catalytic domain-containing protein [Chloroflexota bacterium]
MASAGCAVVFENELRVIERPRPIPAEDEVLIRLRRGGICNTDHELMRGYKHFSGTLGHEFVGEVIEGPAEWLGRRVVGEINISCGICDMCHGGIPTQCRERRVLGILNYDGAFADVFRLSQRNLWPVPDSIPDDCAVFTEPLAAACQILEMAHLRPADRVVLIGAGKLGLLAAQVVRLTGVDFSVVVRHDTQAARLKNWGIQPVPRSAVSDGSADVVIDCTGTAGGFADALDMVRPRGSIMLKSTYHDLPQADLTRVVTQEIHLIGSRCGPFGAALRLLEQGLVDVASLIEAHYPLSEAVRAFEHAARPGALKVLLTPG